MFRNYKFEWKNPEAILLQTASYYLLTRGILRLLGYPIDILDRVHKCLKCG